MRENTDQNNSEYRHFSPSDPLFDFTAWKLSKYGVFSSLYFPAFGLNTERYSYLSIFSPNAGKYRSSARPLKKIENLQKRAVRFWCNYYEILYKELLLESPTSSMNIKRLRAVCAELYKTINKLNPNFMKDLFKLQFTKRSFCEKYKMNMTIPDFNQVSYGKKSLRTSAISY